MTEPRDILEALFVGDDVDRADIARTANAAREDADVRELFDRLALADREVGGDLEARFGLAWFEASLDTMLAEEAPAEVIEISVWRGRQVWLAAAAAIVAVGFSAILYQGLRTPEPEFQARSAAVTKRTDYEVPKVEVFCVERTGDDVTFRGSEQFELATVTCPLSAEIKLAVTNPDARLRYGAFFGVASDNSLYWYGPSPAAPGAVDVPTASELTPIGESIRLDVNHAPGTVRLVGVFSEQPLDFSTLQRWTEEQAQTLRDGDDAPPNSVSVRQTFEVTP